MSSDLKSLLIGIAGSIIATVILSMLFSFRIKHKNSAILRLQQQLAEKEKQLDAMETDRDEWKARRDELWKRLPETALQHIENERHDGNEEVANRTALAWIRGEGGGVSQLLVVLAEWAAKHASGPERPQGLLAAELYATSALLFDRNNVSAESLRDHVARVRQEEGERPPSLAAALSFDGHQFYDPGIVAAANEAETEANRLLRAGSSHLALPKVEEALSLRLQVLAHDAPSILKTRRLKAQILMLLGRYADARVEANAVLEGQHENTAISQRDVSESHFVLAQILDRLGEREEALNEASFSLEMLTATSELQEPSRLAFQTRNLIVAILQGLGRHTEALAEGKSLLADERADPTLDPSDEVILHTRYSIVHSLCDLHQSHEDLLQEAKSLVSAFANKNAEIASMTTYSARVLVSDILSNLKRYDEAIEEIRAVISDCGGNPAVGPRHQQTLFARHRLATILRNAGRGAAALEQLASLVKDEESSNASDAEKLWTRFCVAVTLTDLGEYNEALESATSLFTDQESTLGSSHRDTILTNNLITEIQRRAKSA